MSTKVLLFSEDKNLISEFSGFFKTFYGDLELIIPVNTGEVFNYLEKKEITILFLDISSKYIDYDEIISKAKDKAPDAFRIIIYDSLKKEKAFSYLADVHRLILKPLKSEELHKSISHFVRLKNFQLDANIISSINQLGVTPILPDIYIRLEREMNKQEVSVHRIADIISDDPSVAAKILHIIYASFYNVSKGVVNLIHAINFLGLDIIKHLVLYVKIFNVKNLSLEAQNQLKALREHSIMVAKVSKAIMNIECKDRDLIDSAYIAGLLHDIGKILLIQFNDKPKRTTGVGNGKVTPVQIDKAGEVSHVSVGSYLLSLWNFTPELIDAISHHHNLGIINSEKFTLSQCVFIANALIKSDTEALSKIEEVYGKQKLMEWTEVIPSKLGAA